MNFDYLKKTLTSNHYPAYRFNQLIDAVMQGVTEWQGIKGWPADLKAAFSKQAFFSFKKYHILTSFDGTQKAALTLQDDSVIETVLMQPKPNMVSVCVSSEVGCPMGCAFCATGKMGFKRLLTAEEITDQWLFWLLHAKSGLHHPSHLVFMGMGEPFHNRLHVFQAIQILHDYYQVGWRKISVSTCGVIPGIEALAKELPQVNLAISLHAATEMKRNGLMPINKAYSLSRLKAALVNYTQLTKRQVMFEYILLDQVNDQPEDRAALIKWLKGIPPSLVHVNLIRFNPTKTPFHQPQKDIVHLWKHALHEKGISVSIRKNLGTDIFGACGQLASSHVSGFTPSSNMGEIKSAKYITPLKVFESKDLPE